MLYRKYFVEIRKFEPFPMQLSFENVIDFVLWLRRQPEVSTFQTSGTPRTAA